MRDFTDALNDIIRSMKLAIEFTENMSLSDFLNDEKTQFAAIRCLEIIGEATKRLPEEYRKDNPDIRWKAMAGMRDRLIHAYDVVDAELVWRTIQKTIPPVQEKLTR